MEASPAYKLHMLPIWILMLKSWYAKQTMSLWEAGQMILIPITWKYSFLPLRCVWADTDWQIETVTVLWVKIVGCQSANQPCKPDILFSGQSSLPPPPRLARLSLSSVSYRACARVCVCFHHFTFSSRLPQLLFVQQRLWPFQKLPPLWSFSSSFSSSSQ